MRLAAANLIAMKCSAFLALVVAALALPAPPERRRRVVPRGREARARGPRRHHDPGGCRAPARRADGGRASPRHADRRSARHAAALRHRLAAHRHRRPRRALRGRPRRARSRIASASSCAPCEASPASAACACSLTGGVPVGLFPGYDLRRPLTRPSTRQPCRRSTTRDVQQELVDLGFMAPSGSPARWTCRRRLPCSVSRSGSACRATARSAPRRSRRSNGRPGPSRSCASRDAGSRCSSAASSRS